MEVTKTKYLTLDIDENKVAILTISNPPVNAFNLEMFDEIDMIEHDPAIDWANVRCLLVRSEGKYFSAGLNMNDLGALTPFDISSRLPKYHAIYRWFQDANFPVVMAVQKLCPGAGCELILGSDICIAGESAKFSLPELDFGLAPDMGGTARLARAVGPRVAKRILLCGDALTAEEAKAYGLIEFVVPDDELQQFAMDLATKLAKKSKWAMRFAKKGINCAAEGGMEAGLLLEQVQSTFCLGAEDKEEAVKAFFEKRDPVFK